MPHKLKYTSNKIEKKEEEKNYRKENKNEINCIAHTAKMINNNQKRKRNCTCFGKKL